MGEIIAAMTFSQKVAEVFYLLIGIIFILTGKKALDDKDCPKRVTSAIFWFIVAFTFIAGYWLNALGLAWIIGLCVVVMAAMTACGLVSQSKSDVPTASETRANADKYGMKSFIPPVVLALTAVLVATFWTALGSNNALCLSGVVGLIVVFLLFKPKAEYVVKDGTRLMDNVGTVSLLPQILAALGKLFTAAGVGEVIAAGVSAIVPENNLFIAVVVYCVAMALFTMIMGNGFAAFSVITVGIGIPFLIAKGADPVIVGALGLTAGYCGTLMTPMAANFNIMPAALLETKSKYSIIKSQVPVALIMLLIHIILMYTLAF